MNGCSESKKGFFLGIDEVNQAHESCNFSFFDLYFSEEDDSFGYRKDKLRSWFNQIIPIYLREVYSGKCFRPLPAMVGDGRSVDLFDLFWVVRNMGGFRAVSANCLWGLVAEQCGFCAELIASVKLVYINYLKDFDRWLRRVFKNNRSGNGEIENFKKLDLLIEELEELRGLVRSKEDEKRCSGKLEANLDATGSSVDFDSGKSKSHLSDGKVFNMVHNNTESMLCVDFRNWKTELVLSDGRRNVSKVSDKCVVDNIIGSQKNESCYEAELDKVQDSVETGRSDDNNEKLGGQDNYDILFSAKNVVDEVISSMGSECCSLAEGENVQENVANTYDNDEKHTDESAKRIADEGENMHVQDEANVVSSSIDIGNNLPSSRKRKLKATSLSGMLNWVTEVATCPDDPAVGVIPGPSKSKDNGTEAYRIQALLARDRILARTPIYENSEESSIQKKLKMHTSIHEDKCGLHQSEKRARCSKTLPLTESDHCPCSNTCSATPNKLISPCEAKIGNKQKVPSSSSTDEVLSMPVLNASHTEEAYANVRHVSVGHRFQAKVPEWTGVTSESDSKWLGKQMWPPEDGNSKAPLGEHGIGKGRQTSCDCSFPGSTGCIRFHIAESRLELKLALGPLFYRWGFDRMGEEVSLSWTTEEEKRFKNMVIHNDTGLNKFWKDAFRLFPCKTREQLVSYYFNVLVHRRRIYQNRVTPKNIDSDDDETEFGSIGDSAYFEGNNTLDSDPPICFLNTHLKDLE